MARPKGSKNKPAESAPKAVYGNEPANVSNAPAVAEPVQITANEAQAETAQFDTCRYHEDEPPRVFKAGEIIPTGWVDTPAKLTRTRWELTATGSWEKRPKE